MIEIISFTKHGGPLTKRISLAADGTLCSDGSHCQMASGSVQRVRLPDLDALARLLGQLTPEEAIGLGALRGDLPEVAEITTKAKLEAFNGSNTALIATTGLERRAAERAEDVAQEEGDAAYAEELLPALFYGEWRLSTRHANFPAAVLNLGRHRYCPSLHAIFDHPIVFRRAGTKGKDSYKNTVIIGRPYPIVGDDGELASAARENVAFLASLGWGCWWRRDLSTWYPGWTQLVIAKHDLQACGTSDGFTPIASASAGMVWDEYKDLPKGWRG